MRKELEAEEEETRQVISEEQSRNDVIDENRQRMAVSRQSDDGKQAPLRLRTR